MVRLSEESKHIIRRMGADDYGRRLEHAEAAFDLLEELADSMAGGVYDTIHLHMLRDRANALLREVGLR